MQFRLLGFPLFEYSGKLVVSSDVMGTAAGRVYDATLAYIVGNGEKQLVKTVSWYN